MDSQTQAQLDEALLKAATLGSTTEIHSLLDRHADIYALDIDNYTPLHHASLNGHHQCIDLLLDRHANINALNANHQTPLHDASLNGHHQCIEVLIDHCANKSLIDVRDCELSISISREILHLPFAALTLCLSLSMIRRPSAFPQNTRAHRQDARGCSIDSRSRCVTLSLMHSCSLCVSPCLLVGIDSIIDWRLEAGLDWWSRTIMRHQSTSLALSLFVCVFAGARYKWR